MSTKAIDHITILDGENRTFIPIPTSSDEYGGIKADPKISTDTQAVRVGTDGKLYTKETNVSINNNVNGGVTLNVNGVENYLATPKAVADYVEANKDVAIYNVTKNSSGRLEIDTTPDELTSDLSSGKSIFVKYNNATYTFSEYIPQSESFRYDRYTFFRFSTDNASGFNKWGIDYAILMNVNGILMVGNGSHELTSQITDEILGDSIKASNIPTNRAVANYVASQVTPIVKISQEEYDLIEEPDENTVYIIVG